MAQIETEMSKKSIYWVKVASGQTEFKIKFFFQRVNGLRTWNYIEGRCVI